VDVSTPAATRGRIELDGRPIAALPEGEGRHRLWRAVDPVSGPAEVRLVVESAHRPRDRDPASADGRLLGVFLHQVRLVAEAAPDALDFGAAEDGHPALVTGLWGREAWPEGAGRWTASEAAWRLTPPVHPTRLRLDVGFAHPDGRTRGTAWIDGRRVGTFDEPNGRRTLSFPWTGAAGRPVDVHLRVEPAFRPRDRVAGSHDPRTLGLVLHAAALEGEDDGAVRVPRAAAERTLEIEFSTAAPLTSGRFEAAGQVLHTFRRGPGRETARVDVSRFGGDILTVRTIVDFPPDVPSPVVVHRIVARP
jgi:hypothetical protein